MTKDEKEKLAEALRAELARAQGVLLSGFEGITVAQDTDLRTRLAKAGAKYRVVKNSMIERATQGTPVEPMAKKLRGTTSLAYTDSDAVGLARIITAYAKENPLLIFKTGIVEGRVAMQRFHPWVGAQTFPCPRCQLRIYLERDDAPSLADDTSHDGRVVTGSAAQV